MNGLTGDILDITEGVIVHQVNTKLVAGAGMALAIRRRYPAWYTAYKASDPVLGRVMYYRVARGLVVASLYAQEGIGRHRRQTNYAALGKALCDLGIKTQGGSRPQVYVPYRLGCGLAGGDWSVVLPLIADALPHAVIVRRRK